MPSRAKAGLRLLCVELWVGDTLAGTFPTMLQPPGGDWQLILNIFPSQQQAHQATMTGTARAADTGAAACGGSATGIAASSAVSVCTPSASGAGAGPVREEMLAAAGVSTELQVLAHRMAHEGPAAVKPVARFLRHLSAWWEALGAIDAVVAADEAAQEKEEQLRSAAAAVTAAVKAAQLQGGGTGTANHHHHHNHHHGHHAGGAGGGAGHRAVMPSRPSQQLVALRKANLALALTALEVAVRYGLRGVVCHLMWDIADEQGRLATGVNHPLATMPRLLPALQVRTC